MTTSTTSALIPNLFPKNRLSASDFRPFSLSSKSKNVAKKDSKERRPSKEERYSNELNLFKMCSNEIRISDGDSSSSDDDSDDDDSKSLSKPSSSSGRASRTSKGSRTSSEKRRVRFQSPEKLVETSDENGASKDDKSDIVEPKSGSNSPKSVPKNCDTTTKKSANNPGSSPESILKPAPVRKDPYASLTKDQIIAHMRKELFSIPGDPVLDYGESSEDENNIVEASCGHSPTAMNESAGGKLPSQVIVERISKPPSPDTVTVKEHDAKPMGKSPQKTEKPIEKSPEKAKNEKSPEKSKNNEQSPEPPGEMNPEVLRTLEKVVEGLVSYSPKKKRDSSEKKVARKSSEKIPEAPLMSIFEHLQKSPTKVALLPPSPRKKRPEGSPERRSKDDDDSMKSKMVNCPICGKVLMEKSSSLQDHYDQCHTPQRTDANCLGHIPTHRHSDGTAFVKINETEKLSGHQCFVCHRICADARQLRLHWQLHKTYVAEEEAENAVDSETEDLDSSRENCALDMSVEEVDAPINLAYDFRLDISEPEDLTYSSYSDSTDDESESEIERQRLGFQAKGLATAEKMGCVGNSPDSKSKTKRTRKKKVKSEEEEEEKELDPARRCPDCDVMFADAVVCSQHKLRDHGTRLMYRCVREECRKVFHHHRAYRQHHRQEHRQRAFICRICNDHVSVFGQLTSHIKNKHRFLGKSHDFRCRKCGIDFPSKAMLVTHRSGGRKKKLGVVAHEGEVKMEVTEFPSESLKVGHGKCLICMSDFNDFQVFETHIDEHFRKEYSCSNVGCEETTDDLHSMRRHLHTHYDVIDDNLTCPRCGKVSKSGAQNRMHCRSCNHKCNVCPRSFIIDEELYAHFMKQHFWVNLICPFCSEVIPSIVDFVNHQKQLHLAFHSPHMNLKPKINVHLYTEELVQYFPELKSKFPEIANGNFGFVSLVRSIPHWWKLPPAQRQEKAMEHMAKMVKAFQRGIASGSKQPEEGDDRKRKTSDESTESDENVFKKARMAPLEVKEEVKSEPCDNDDRSSKSSVEKPKPKPKPRSRKSGSEKPKAGNQAKPGKRGSRPGPRKMVVKMKLSKKNE